MFISQTRLTQTAATGTHTPIAPVDRARFDGLVQTVAEAMSYVPVVQRPDLSDWGGFELRYDLRCAIAVTILGVRNDGHSHLLIYWDTWHTEADRLSGQPPVFRESLETNVKPRGGRNDIKQFVRDAIRAALVNASLHGWSGDWRDQSIEQARTELDASGVLDELRTLEATRELDTAVSNPSSAPLLPKVAQ